MLLLVDAEVGGLLLFRYYPIDIIILLQVHRELRLVVAELLVYLGDVVVEPVELVVADQLALGRVLSLVVQQVRDVQLVAGYRIVVVMD